MVYTGSIIDSRNREALQEEVANATYSLWETKSSAHLVDGVPLYYTQNAFPTTGMTLLTMNYYDDYAFDTLGLNAPASVYGQTITTATKSLVTGSKIRVLGTNTWITSLSYYDFKGRMIYGVTKNEYLQTVDQIETKVDFVGRTVQSKTTHQKGTATPLVTTMWYTYDHQGRLLTEEQQLNTQAKERISSHTYDELGRLVRKAVGGKATATTALQQLDYRYTIRGWMSQLNEVANLGQDLFGYKINYTLPEQNLGASARYDGNISELLWKTANEETIQAYGYQYDAMNRLIKAQSNTGQYDLKHIAYDKNGNLLSLKRQGHINETATGFGLMDDLSYTYGAGNQLLAVADAASTFGFKDGHSAGNDYAYDVNGNMTIDRNKGISTITYNHLNLPTGVSIANSEHNGNIQYVYDATGVKLKKVTTANGQSTSTSYAGNYVYKNDQLEFFNHSEGYIEPTAEGTYTYTYQFTDHLGNIRLAYSDMDNDGRIDVLRNTIDVDGDGDRLHEIKTIKDYYPFGLQRRYGVNHPNSIIAGRKHNYGFNGIELTEDLGMELYEMDVRKYDPTIARWTGIDPVIHYSLSTYNAFDNNPVVFADPSGADSTFGVTGGTHYGNYGSDTAIFDVNGSRDYFFNQATHHGDNVAAGLADAGFVKDSNVSVFAGDLYTAFGGDYKEGQRRVSGANPHFIGKSRTTEYYHAGGVNGSEAGWYSKGEYFELFRTTIRNIGQGLIPFESLNEYNFTEDVFQVMVGWAVQAYNTYGGERRIANGNIEAMGFDSPVFMIASLASVGRAFLSSRAAKEGAWDVLSTNLKYDKGAHALADEIGGVAQARFRNSMREFDAISNKFIGQHKPALGNNFGKSFKNQARATFDAAKKTGRDVYYRFDGKPGQKVIDKLNQYSSEYGVPVIIKY